MASATDNTSSAPPREKMPKGAERDPSAMCYIHGPSMASDIRTGPALRSVDPSQIRDASNPAIHAEIESDTHDREPTFDRTKFTHVNHPKPGDVLGASFLLHYVDPPAFDQEVEVILKESGGEAATHVGKLRMDGNQIKETVSRADFASGEYELIVQALDGTPKAQVHVIIE